MKRKCMLLCLALLLCLSALACAETNVEIEVIKVDGVSIVVLTPEKTILRAVSPESAGKSEEEKQAGFVLPEALTLIGVSAFEGIKATKIEVSEQVAAIESRAFADCKSLREIVIPASVRKIDDHAFDGCESVTVYGTKGSEAERIASLYQFTFVDPEAQDDPPSGKTVPSAPVLPPVPLPS